MRTDAKAVGKTSIFTANMTSAELAAFNTAMPNHFAVEHACSQKNQGKLWGKWTLQSIEFAYFLLNETYGASAALTAAEQDA